MTKLTFKDWDGSPLEGLCLVTTKMDGIQIRNTGKEIVTKAGNPVYNLPSKLPDFEVAELFCGTWNETMSIGRSSKSKRRQARKDEIYPLFPKIDPRLIIGEWDGLSRNQIRALFKNVLRLGHEGLVIQNKGKYIKVKPTYTHDLKITGMVEGNGRLKGKLGKLETELGGCG